MKVTVLKNGKATRTYECDTYEDIYECGYEVLYVEKDGIRTKACTLGNFGYDTWSYDVEY